MTRPARATPDEQVRIGYRGHVSRIGIFIRCHCGRFEVPCDRRGHDEMIEHLRTTHGIELSEVRDD